VPALRLVAGDAHRSACHYAEDLAGVTVDTLRSMVATSDLVPVDEAVGEP
jgi:hypothetical protein